MTCVQHSLRTNQTTTPPQVRVPLIADSQSVFVPKGFQPQIVSPSQSPQSQSLPQQEPQPHPELEQQLQSLSLSQVQSQLQPQPQPQSQEERENGSETTLTQTITLTKIPAQEVEKGSETPQLQPQELLDQDQEQEQKQTSDTRQSQEQRVTQVQIDTIPQHQENQGEVTRACTEDSSPQSSSPEQSHSSPSLDQFSSSSGHSDHSNRFNSEESTSERESEKDSQLSYDTTCIDDNSGNLSVHKKGALENKSRDGVAHSIQNQSTEPFDNTDSHSFADKEANGSSSPARYAAHAPQHQQLKLTNQRPVALPQRQRQTSEEYRERAAQEQRRRERQCAFPTAKNTADLHQHAHQPDAMGSQVQHHQHRTHQNQLQMFPQQQQQHHQQQQQQQQHHHHQAGHTFKRPNTARSAAPPPQPKETMNPNNRPTNTSSSSHNLNQQQQHAHYLSSQNRVRYLAHNTNTNAANTTSGTEGSLYYDRLVMEEDLELKEYARRVQTQECRIASLQSIHSDLEGRLELQTAQRMQLEEKLVSQEIQWAETRRRLESERDEWKELVTKEQTRNERLLEFANRKEKEIQRMIQRKYEPKQRTASRSTTNIATANQSRINQNHEAQQQHHGMMVGGDPFAYLQSPHEILEANASMQAGRETNATRNLLDFFGV